MMCKHRNIEQCYKKQLIVNIYCAFVRQTQEILQNSRYKKILCTFGGKDDAGHWFRFVLRLSKSGAEMSSAIAVCEPTDSFRKQS